MLKFYSSFLLCLNDNCPRAKECLHNSAYKDFGNSQKTINIINPNLYIELNAECSYFKTNQNVKIAWGLRTLLDSLSYDIAKSMRRRLIQKFGQTKYYRFYREELPILPEDQKTIKQIFLDEGIESDPQFNRFTMEVIY